ncbi:MAG: DNA topoisomerase [Clostridia bacterium]|nr:DNA topoisomerase [Clostridia bacterium]
MSENKKRKEYGDQSITSLKGPDQVRKRPGVIFGSDGLEGCQHSFFEILSNSIDEAREGYGNRINITVTRDMVITVEDFGRGIPLDWNEGEEKYNWELVFCTMYAGGKYNNDDGEAYEYSLGLNGLGACATQFASEFMDVTSYTKKGKYEIKFEKGFPITELIKTEPKRRTGTVITWKPDLDVFTDIRISEAFISEVLKKQAIVNPNLTLALKYEQADGSFKEYSYFYERGIEDYVEELITSPENVIMPEITESSSSDDETEEEAMARAEKAEAEAADAGEKEATYAITKPQYISCERVGRDRDDKDDYKLKIEAVFCFSNQVNVIEYYHNSSWLEHGGSPDKATRSAFVKALDKYLKGANKYSKNESKISFQDIEESLVFVVNSHSTRTSYENQTKKAITNTFITEAMTDFFAHSLEVYFTENPKEAEKIGAQILINKRSRENVEKARIDIKKKLTSGNLGIADRVEKFVNCRSKDADKKELYIVEGDSAMTSVKHARNPEFQAVMPVRGKTLNCMKSTYDKIFASKVIVDLLRVIGCGVEIKAKGNKNLSQFDLNSLRWNKIVICTDADEDGYQIRTLILTMFYRLLPTLINLGKVYIAESPLYEIKVKDKSYFAYNEAEKAEILSKIGDQKYIIERSKGLGENNPEMMSFTTMAPETRRLIKIMPEDEAATLRMFETLLGDDILSRKAFITEHGAEYIDLADI